MMPTFSFPLSDITVMFNPEPWKIGPSGYSAFIFGAKAYSLFDGPATLEMITLWIAAVFSGVWDHQAQHEFESDRVATCVQSIASVGTMARPCSFALEPASAIARSRSAGSSMWVWRLQNIPDS